VKVLSQVKTITGIVQDLERLQHSLNLKTEPFPEALGFTL
jgi:hypothetical protein